MNNSFDSHIRIPSKTFILGEYAVLKGGTALVANTAPSFSFSSSGKLVDPHQGRGGFGASSAELLFAWKEKVGGVHFDPWQVVTELRQSTLTNRKSNTSAHLPSGADIVAQYIGGVAKVDVASRTSSSDEWPWHNFGFSIFRTGEKLATHTHLDQVEISDLGPLVELSRHGARALSKSDWAHFAALVRQYADVLSEMKLVAPRTHEQLRLVRTHSRVLAAKGCGAMGADTILVLHENLDTRHLRDSVERLAHLEFVAGHENLAKGMAASALGHSSVFVGNLASESGVELSKDPVSPRAQL